MSVCEQCVMWGRGVCVGGVGGVCARVQGVMRVVGAVCGNVCIACECYVSGAVCERCAVCEVCTCLCGEC